jgi:membrane AbrB-like protein
MTTVSLGFGADGAAVATLQFVRVLLAVAIVGLVVARYRAKDKSTSSEEDTDEQDGAPAEESGLLEDVKRLGIAAPWGILGGVIGLISSLPAAGIVGALVGTTAFRLITDRRVPTTKYQHGVQILSGGVIGIEISGRFFSELLTLAMAGAVIIAVQMVLWLVTSWMLTKFFGYDAPTAALASSPGGISGVVPAANEAGADLAVVSFMHLTRLGTIVAVVPIFVSLSFGG